PEAFAMPAAGTRQVISATSALVLLGTISILLFFTEPIAARFGFAVAVTVAITSFVSLLSRRLLFSSVIAFSLVAMVFLISLENHATMNMGLHSYDLFFYLNADTLEFGAFRLFTQNDSFVSAFYLSWSETWGTLVRGQLVEAAARTPLP